jgi:ferredoxin
MARVQANTDACVGSANCVYTAPDIFELGEEGTVVVRQPEPPADRQAAAEAAVRGCPAAALQIVDE